MRSNLDKNTARIELQIREALNKRMAEKQLQESNKVSNNRDALMSEIYNSYASAEHNKRVKTQLAERAFTYGEHFAKVALINTLSECVEKSLLLNEEEYAKLNPNYKAEIKQTVTDFLENADINTSASDYLTEFLESVKAETPLADLYLTEEDEFNIVSGKILSKENINNKLDNMCRDVRARVATIVSNDQKALADQQNDIDYISSKEVAQAPVQEVPVQDDILQDPELQAGEQPLVQESVNTPEPKKITINVIKEEYKRPGIVETLTLNEANKMLNEGAQYDKTLALANAIKYITILETLDASGLVTVGEKQYNSIIDASQDSILKSNLTKAKTTLKEDTQAPVLTEEQILHNKVSGILRNTLPSELYETVMDSQYDYSLFKPLKKICEEKQNEVPHGCWTDVKGNVYTESALREYFVKQGFLETDDIESIAYDWNFKRH